MADDSTYYLTRWLFLRALGFIYLFAFASFFSQVDGLIGSGGVCPAADLLHEVAKTTGEGRYWLVPSLAWIDPSDWFLRFLCGGGVVLSVLLILGVGTTPVLVLLWLFWLSIVTVCDVFSGFQSDGLLLEAGFLAIFLAPAQLLAPHWRVPAWMRREPAPSPIVLWLLRWLVFRLVFGSGLAKLLSGDTTWRNLTALTYHYETQPLPTPLGWYAHHLPVWLQKLSVVGTYVSELVGPPLMFGPRTMRLVSAILMAVLQVLIFLTGNYTFLNLLTIALCIPLLDDALLRPLLPGWLSEKIALSAQESTPLRFELYWVVPLATVFVLVSCAGWAAMFFGTSVVPRPGRLLAAAVAPFRTINSYGVFGVMTTRRLEVVVEGSRDGKTWQEYEFKYEPGDLKKPPPWVAPHQPRLDWRFWFAAMDDQPEPWVLGFTMRLLQGSPEVLELMGKNPFPGAPPRYVRVLRYQYRFTDIKTLKRTGQWWQRDYMGVLLPPVTLHRGDVFDPG
ncbi:MAG TPA: lipase maturation factor family protein [Candidatus Obscuribacterales bacterium]